MFDFEGAQQSPLLTFLLNFVKSENEHEKSRVTAKKHNLLNWQAYLNFLWQYVIVCQLIHLDYNFIALEHPYVFQKLAQRRS